MAGMETPNIGQSVKRVQPGDYTDGRIGSVIEIDAGKGRVRVLWHTGGPRQGGVALPKPLRTWVKQSVIIAAGMETNQTARLTERTETQPDVVEKWIVGDERRMGPSKEWLVPIPRHHFMDEDWYFRLEENEAVPQSRLFDTPQEAALAAIALHDETIRWASVQKRQLQDWRDKLLEAERVEKEKSDAAAKGQS